MPYRAHLPVVGMDRISEQHKNASGTSERVSRTLPVELLEIAALANEN